MRAADASGWERVALVDVEEVVVCVGGWVGLLGLHRSNGACELWFRQEDCTDVLRNAPGRRPLASVERAARGRPTAAGAGQVRDRTSAAPTPASAPDSSRRTMSSSRNPSTDACRGGWVGTRQRSTAGWAAVRGAAGRRAARRLLQEPLHRRLPPEGGWGGRSGRRRPRGAGGTRGAVGLAPPGAPPQRPASGQEAMVRQARWMQHAGTVAQSGRQGTRSAQAPCPPVAAAQRCRAPPTPPPAASTPRGPPPCAPTCTWPPRWPRAAEGQRWGREEEQVGQQQAGREAKGERPAAHTCFHPPFGTSAHSPACGASWPKCAGPLGTKHEPIGPPPHRRACPHLRRQLAKVQVGREAGQRVGHARVVALVGVLGQAGLGQEALVAHEGLDESTGKGGSTERSVWESMACCASAPPHPQAQPAPGGCRAPGMHASQAEPTCTPSASTHLHGSVLARLAPVHLGHRRPARHHLRQQAIPVHRGRLRQRTAPGRLRACRVGEGGVRGVMTWARAGNGLLLKPPTWWVEAQGSSSSSSSGGGGGGGGGGGSSSSGSGSGSGSGGGGSGSSSNRSAPAPPGSWAPPRHHGPGTQACMAAGTDRRLELGVLLQELGQLGVQLGPDRAGGVLALVCGGGVRAHACTLCALCTVGVGRGGGLGGLPRPDRARRVLAPVCASSRGRGLGEGA